MVKRVMLSSPRKPHTEHTTTLLDACRDPKLFGSWFRKPSDWQPWFAFIAALFGLPMTSEQLAIYQQCTGRTEAPTEPAEEGWLVVGRRGGKSFILALCAVFIATFRDHRKFLSPGEIASVMIVAQDRKQCRIILRYIKALLAIPILKRKISAETRDSVELDCAVVIEVHTASAKSTRGYAACAILADELAFWPTDDSAEPDYAVLGALRPTMAQFPHALLLCASSPYWKKGSLWDAHQAHFAKDGDPVLVWQADTKRMNPSITQRWIDRETAKDPVAAAAEYGALFRTDLEAFVSREVVEAAIVPGRFELAPQSRITYYGFTDPAGGSGGDSFAIAIGHRGDDDEVIVDAVREIKPVFSPENVVEQFSHLLKSYGIRTVVGDSYAGEWPREQFRKRGIDYELSELPKSAIYQNVLPLLNSCQVELLDLPRLTAQLCSLERRTPRGGRDSIDHARGNGRDAHDDVANCVCGVISITAERRRRLMSFGPVVAAFQNGRATRLGRRGSPSNPATVGHVRG